MKIQKSHLTAEQPSIKKSGTYQKRYSTSKHKETNHYKMVGGAHLRYNWIPYSHSGQPTIWRIILSKKFSYRRVEYWGLGRLPSLGGLVWWAEAPTAFGLKGQWGLIAEVPQDLGKSRSILGGCIQGLMHTRTQDKSSDFTGAWPKSTCWS